MRRHPFRPLIPTYLQVAAGLLFYLVGGGSQAALFERSADNLQQEAKAAHAEGKRLAVALTLPDCPGCREMEKTAYRDRRTEKLIEGRFRTVRLDLSRSAPIIDALGRATTVADLAKRLRAVATPSFVFFASDGSFSYRYTGTLDQAGLRDLADYVVRAKFEDFPFAPRNAARGNPAARQERALHASPPAGSLPLYLQLVAEKRPSASAGYTVDHTAGVFLFDANGRLRGLAPFGQSVADLRSDLAHLLAEGSGGPAIAQRLARAN